MALVVASEAREEAMVVDMVEEATSSGVDMETREDMAVEATKEAKVTTMEEDTEVEAIPQDLVVTGAVVAKEVTRGTMTIQCLLETWATLINVWSRTYSVAST